MKTEQILKKHYSKLSLLPCIDAHTAGLRSHQAIISRLFDNSCHKNIVNHNYVDK